MAVKEYNSTDMVPVFVHVLDMCAYFYSQIALKIAAIDHYQELRGNSETREVNNAVLIIIASAVKSISSTLLQMSENYAFNIEQCLNSDKRIARISENLYWGLVCDEFPATINADDSANTDYFEMLDLYALSLLNILRGVFEMFCYGKLDLDNFYSQKKKHNDFWLSRDCDPKHMYALVKLLELNNQLLANAEDLQRGNLKFKYKQHENYI